jgi:hypothetical protein
MAIPVTLEALVYDTLTMEEFIVFELVLVEEAF